jgi:NAD(P)H-dependent FMN reductase
LPVADPEFQQDLARCNDERVGQFMGRAASCGAFVLSTPIYHNSYSGILKNALDYLTSAHFSYKPVGLVSHGGSGGTQAVDHLRIVVRAVLGVAIPTQVCTTSHDYRQVVAGSYELQADDIPRRIERFAEELMAFAHHLQPLRRAAGGTFAVPG